MKGTEKSKLCRRGGTVALGRISYTKRRKGRRIELDRGMIRRGGEITCRNGQTKKAFPSDTQEIISQPVEWAGESRKGSFWKRTYRKTMHQAVSPQEG